MFSEHQKKIKIYVKAVCEGDINSFVLVGRAGLGKTYLISQVLEELKLQPNVNYIYLNSYITATELYIMLERVNRLLPPKLLVLDDIEYSIRDRKVVSLLKSALWEGGNGKRQINYQSGTYRVSATQISDFQGKVIINLNEFKVNNPLLKALRDRGLFYQFEPTDQEIRQAVRELANKPYKNINQSDRIKIAEYILSKTKPKELSLRSLIKFYNLYLANNNLYKTL